jgi:hypothetical protein
VVLSYSGLGFGAMPTASPPEDGSTCQIEIDDPDWDGQAGKQLISFLGGEPGIGYTTYSETTKAYSGPVTDHDVLLDTHDHNPADAGKPDPYDPRVGMIGGSEGGEVQFAVADVDPRLDMIIPEITWNDLAFSLGPNNTSLPPHSDSYTTPGVLKLDWPVLFSAIGEEDGVDKDVTQPATLAGTGVCPNFDPQVCTALATSAGLGYPPSDASASDPVGSLSPSLDAVGFLRHRSVESYMANIRIPVLLAQGQADTLFELSEAATTFHALQAQGTPVKMIWQSWGHSDSTPVAGEDVLGDAGSPEGGMFQAWFDHYLKGENTDLGPTFSYYRDWDYHPGAATGARRRARGARRLCLVADLPGRARGHLRPVGYRRADLRHPGGGQQQLHRAPGRRRQLHRDQRHRPEHPGHRRSRHLRLLHAARVHDAGQRGRDPHRDAALDRPRGDQRRRTRRRVGAVPAAGGHHPRGHGRAAAPAHRRVPDGRPVQAGDRPAARDRAPDPGWRSAPPGRGRQ